MASPTPESSVFWLTHHALWGGSQMHLALSLVRQFLKIPDPWLPHPCGGYSQFLPRQDAIRFIGNYVELLTWGRYTECTTQ